MCCRLPETGLWFKDYGLSGSGNFKKYDTVLLDASLAAVCLYEHRGYKTAGHGIYELENDVKLVYEIMEKKLKVN